MAQADQGCRASRLFLHVGPHKTGTTSFQAAISLKYANMIERGITPCIGAQGKANLASVANVFLRAELVTTPRLRKTLEIPDPASSMRQLHEFSKHLAEVVTPDMLISSEEFSLLRTPAEQERLSRFFLQHVNQIIPILVRRNPQSWRASREGQLRKRKVWDILAELPDDRSGNGEWYYDWGALQAFWQGIGPVRVIDYETAVAETGSILPALAQSIDQPGLFDDQEDIWLNKRRNF